MHGSRGQGFNMVFFTQFILKRDWHLLATPPLTSGNYNYEAES